MPCLGPPKRCVRQGTKTLQCCAHATTSQVLHIVHMPPHQNVSFGPATTFFAPRGVYTRLSVCLFVCGVYVEFDLVATARVSGSGKSSGSGS